MLYGPFYFKSSILRIIRQGLPTAKQLSGIDLVTTLPAPIVELSPMLTPGKMTVLPPIHALLPIVTGAV